MKDTLQAAMLAGLLTVNGACSVPVVGELSTASGTPSPPAAGSLSETDMIAIPLDLPTPEAASEDSSESLRSAGGLIAADVNGDGHWDLVVTRPGLIAAYSIKQGQLWQTAAPLWLTKQSERQGLPGLHAPGIQVGDVDQDGRAEILYVTEQNQLGILAADSGELKTLVDLPPVDSLGNHWEHAILANFSGQGDRELLLQASWPTLDADDYVRGTVQAAFRLSDLLAEEAAADPLWITDDFVAPSHGPARVVDLNQDGRDEVVGGTILGPQGQRLHDVGMPNQAFPHIDAIAIADIDPTRPGLEAVLPEEAGRKRVFLYDEAGTLWQSRHRSRSYDNDGDKVAVGDFDPQRSGLEMWFRGNNSEHFTVLDAAGRVIASYRSQRRKPDTWTDKGFEVIHRIRWTGGDKDYLAAKERHEAGDVGLFDPLTGEVVLQLPGAAERLYVADILGDWREEVILLEADHLRIYRNTRPNPNPDHPSLWQDPAYRRQKMTWNYYSP